MRNKLILALVLRNSYQSMVRKLCCLFLIFGLFPSLAYSQKEVSFKDSVDHKFDLSDWVLTADGFIPVPVIITEPALGGFGGALFAIFVDENTPYIDTVDGQQVKTRVKPTMYALGGAYTINNSWLAAGATMGVIKKWRMNYRLATGYADINMNFYRDLPNGEEHSFEFNIETFPVYGQLIKQLRRSPWFVGLNYLYLNTKLKLTNEEFHSADDVASNISRLGILVEYDHRDNIFTPDKGFRWNTLTSASDNVLGSDYDFTGVNSAAYLFIPIKEKIIAGFRAEYQQQWGDAPFYMLPYISMRGIPVARYQGNIIGLAETEWRWDFSERYSVIAFGGTGKAIAEDSNFEDADWHSAGGAGFRYLIARKLKLRMGVDVARGPEEWAYYIVFGSSWTR